jgi:hypothetical protein
VDLELAFARAKIQALLSVEVLPLVYGRLAAEHRIDVVPASVLQVLLAVYQFVVVDRLS